MLYTNTLKLFGAVLSFQVFMNPIRVVLNARIHTKKARFNTRIGSRHNANLIVRKSSILMHRQHQWSAWIAMECSSSAFFISCTKYLLVKEKYYFWFTIRCFSFGICSCSTVRVSTFFTSHDWNLYFLQNQCRTLGFLIEGRAAPSNHKRVRSNETSMHNFTVNR